MEVHDILTECARVCLDTTESTRDDRSTCGLSLSESGFSAAYNMATRSNVSSSCKMSSPASENLWNFFVPVWMFSKHENM